MSTAVDAALKAAKAALKAGDALAATRALLPELKRFPGNARLLTQLAEVQAARTGLPARPIGPPHLQRMLQVQRQSGIEAALEEAQLAALLDPANPLASGFLGSLLLEADRFEQALGPLAATHRKWPDNLHVGINLSTALRMAGRGAAAADVARTVLKSHPASGAAHLALARGLIEDGRATEAADLLAQEAAAHPDIVDFAHEHGIARLAAKQYDRAKEAFEAVLQRAPQHYAALNEYGNLCLIEGDFERAEAIFTTAIAAQPDRAAAYYNLVQCKTLDQNSPVLASLLRLADSTENRHEQVLLNFALAKVYEDLQDPAKSFAALSRANGLKKSLYPFDAEEHRKMMQGLKTLHWSAKAQPPKAKLARTPIFVVGMMRSGTSLMEQILSSHPMVYGAGELEQLGQATQLAMQAMKGPLDASAMQRIRESYLSHLNALPTDLPFVTDKMPGNFAFLGVILRALPEARILHMRRDPIAVCWSIYKKNFTGNRLRFSNDLNDIAQYYDAYTDYMAFADSQAPGAICHIDYAELANTPEPVIRRALDHCGLPFDPACLAPEKNDRQIRTASYKQAREGIYQGSTTKWRGFEPYLKPLIDHFARG
jgi:tetratricopeptide (TPR) repeat protein